MGGNEGDTTLWIIVEGQNFDFAIADTQDLSTIRGGSLLLRDGILKAEETLGKLTHEKPQSVSTGGSRGVWWVSLPQSREISDVLGAIRASLTSEGFAHVPFVVAAVKDSKQPYSQILKQLRSAAQRQRYGRSSIIYPQLPKDRQPVCEVDMIRPVQPGKTFRRPGGEYTVSASVHARRQYGMARKQSLMGELLKERQDTLCGQAASVAIDSIDNLQTRSPFAFQINSISEKATFTSAGRKLRSNLGDKICVIHMDGNGFGKIQDEMLEKSENARAKDGEGIDAVRSEIFNKSETVAVQRKYDKEIQDRRTDLIAAVFDAVCRNGGYGAPSDEEALVRKELPKTDGEVFRFETLLWGGDETTFIVPARLGWLVMETMAAKIAGQSIEGKKLNYAVGAVFCHHDAPIARIKTLADELANFAKDRKHAPDGSIRNGREETLFVPVVMESFDHAGGELERFMANRLGKDAREEGLSDLDNVPVAAAGLTFTGAEIAALRQIAEGVTSGIEGKAGILARSQLRKIAQAIHYDTVAAKDKREVGQLVKNGLRTLFEEEDVAQFLLNFGIKRQSQEPDETLSAARRLFAHLEEYWDYLVPLEEPVQTMREAG